FFSSRRRHTRFSRDWSSDVCSSDLNLLGVSIVRELGPVLAAILVAGRSGSAITAQIGVMRVTQELDAMQVMGISPGKRLVLPRRSEERRVGKECRSRSGA